MPEPQLFRYGQENELQTLLVSTLSQVGFWVILIHGGAWRDPTQTSSNFLKPAESILRSTPHYASQTLPHIAGFASISYRLTAHPDYPQNASTDAFDYRNATHPDHIHDVRDALAFLQQKYGFGERYILIGHSCGATLAFQSVMELFKGYGGEIPQPTAIVGTEGIYDLKLLRDTHKDIPTYQNFTQRAFGPDEALWDSVSPAKVGVDWKAGRLAVLAQSSEDQLVDPVQRQAMKDTLGRWEKDQEARRVVELSLEGEHDVPWKEGEGLAKAIATAFDELQSMSLV